MIRTINDRQFGVQFWQERKLFCHAPRPDRLLGPPDRFRGLFPQRQSGPSLKLNASTLICGDVSPLARMLLWHCA
jgi:hypothetical protein